MICQATTIAPNEDGRPLARCHAFPCSVGAGGVHRDEMCERGVRSELENRSPAVRNRLSNGVHTQHIDDITAA
jgi:hypothetical protein